MAIEKIENRQLLFILFIIRAVLPLATLPILTTGKALQDAWLSAILSFLVVAILAFMIVRLGLQFPKQTIVEFSQILLGKWPGIAVSFIPLWAFLHLAATDIRIYGELLNTAFLPSTPLIFIISSMVLLAAIAIYLGLEIIGRMADFLLPWFLGLAIISLIIILPEVSLINFQPVLAKGMGEIMSSSLVSIGFGAQLLILGILIPSITAPQKALKTTLTSLLGAFLVILLVLFVVIGKLGAFEGSYAVFPFLSSIRGLERSEFVERLEIFGILAWGFGLFISVSAYLYCGAKGLAQILKLRDYRPLVFPMAVIWSTLSIHAYESIFEFRSFLSPEIFFPYSLLTIVIPYSILWVAYLFWRREGRVE